ncbi:uncharacterized protein LOC105645473 [Jatropha curcas]|uniref:uncharacterized protein LOC105645473 n=1 Tax=Jatropha curcas TaxID=180498 RepID=UPI0005FBF35E|nr:uncharacterized protein LOC105645473 [Jatropha curcas]
MEADNLAKAAASKIEWTNNAIPLEVQHQTSVDQEITLVVKSLQGTKEEVRRRKDKLVNELNSVLWAFRTTPKKATRETPFSLVYGTEAAIPIEVGAPSVRTLHYNATTNDEQMRPTLDQLEEQRDQASEPSKSMQNTDDEILQQKSKGKKFSNGRFCH